MKKRWIQLALILGLMALACVSACAAETEAPTIGFTRVSVETAYADDVVLISLDENGAEVTVDADEVRYPGAVKMKVAYSKAKPDSEYLLCVLVDDGSGTVTPSVDNMAYIDQQTAKSAAIEFIAFPKKPDVKDNSVKYSVYLSSNADGDESITDFTKVATFEYYSSGSNYTLGDVNDDGSIAVGDAVMVLQAVVDKITLTETQRAAADVNKDDSVAVGDAVAILQFVVDKIHSFDEVQS